MYKFFLMMCLAFTFKAVAQPPNNKRVVGYYAQWAIYARDYQVNDIPADDLSHILYAFFEPKYDPATDSAWIQSLDPYADFQHQKNGTEWNYGTGPNDKGNIGALRVLKQNHPHLKVIISLGGWTRSQDFPAIAASANARSTFSESCNNFITTYGLDGIDLDWEFPVTGGTDGTESISYSNIPAQPHFPDDHKNLVYLLDSLRQHLGPNKELTVVMGNNVNDITSQFVLPGNEVNHNMTSNIMDYCDWVSFFGYDFGGNWYDKTCYNAPLYGGDHSEDPLSRPDNVYNQVLDDLVSLFIDSMQIPTNDLVMGLPFYGKLFENVSTSSSPINSLPGLYLNAPRNNNPACINPTPPQGSWDNITCEFSGAIEFCDLYEDVNGTSPGNNHHYLNPNNYLETQPNSGWVRYWDSIARVPFLYNQTQNKFISYEDPQSIHEKVMYAEQRNMSGVMIWELSQDSRSSDLLINQITTSLLGQNISLNRVQPLQNDTLLGFGPHQLAVQALSPDTITHVEFIIGLDTLPAITSNDSLYTAMWIPDHSGEYTIKAIATDENGAFKEILTSVLVQCTSFCKPQITVQIPEEGTIFRMSPFEMVQMEFRIDDEDGNVDSVYADINGGGALNITQVSDTIYTAEWTPVAYGDYTLNAYVTDDNNLTDTAVITFTIDTLQTFAPIPEKVIVGYWHNWENAQAPFMYLSDISTNYNVIDVSFIETENGDGFSAVFEPLNTRYTSDQDFVNDIQDLKAIHDIPVLISIGGQNGHVELTTLAEKDTFVNRVINIIETYGFDGVDLDFEGGSMNFGGTVTDFDYNSITLPRLKYMIDAIREIHDHFGEQFIITAAPEVFYVQVGYSAYSGTAGAWLPVLDNIRDILDFIHVQLYNTGSVNGLDNAAYSQANPDFIVAMTDMLLTGFDVSGTGIYFEPLNQNQVAIGLPACPSAAPAGGYLQPSEVKKALDYLIHGDDFVGRNYTANGTYPDLKGIMTWSVNWDEAAGCASTYEFADAYYDYFYGTNINTIAINPQSEDTITEGDVLTLSVSTSHESGISSVNFTIDGEVMNATNAQDSIYEYIWTADSVGYKTLYIDVTAIDGSQQTDSVQFVVPCTSNCLPEIQFISHNPLDSVFLETLSPVQLSAHASDVDGAVSVIYRTNGQVINSTQSGNQFTGSWTPATFGTHIVWAIVEDSDNQQDSVSVTLEIIDNSDCGSPLWNSSSTYSVSGTKVKHNNKVWQNQWWSNPGEEPGQNSVWLEIATCSVNQAPEIQEIGILDTIYLNTLTDVSLQYNITDADDNVVSVQHNINSGGWTSTSETSTNTFTVVLTPTTFGTYQITLEATDANSTTATHTTTIVLAQQINYSLDILTPIHQDTIVQSTGFTSINLETQLTDPSNEVDSVWYILNGQHLIPDYNVSTSNYGLQWVPDVYGQFTYIAFATNLDDGTLVSDTVLFTVSNGNSLPEITFLQPNTDTVYQQNFQPFTITFEATDANGTIDSVFWKTSTIPYTQVLPDVNSISQISITPQNYGDLTLTVKAKDNLGDVKEDSITYYISAIPQPTIIPQTVTDGSVITQPLGLSSIGINTLVTTIASVTDSVKYEINGVSYLAQPNSGNLYTLDWTPVAYDTYTLDIQVWNNIHGLVTESITFQVIESEVPEIDFLQPVDLTVYSTSSVVDMSFSFMAISNTETIDSVYVQIGSNWYTAIHDSLSYYSITWTSQNFGDYNITAYAESSSGSIGQSLTPIIHIIELEDCPIPAYNSLVAYTGGSIVSHLGNLYSANYWTQGAIPSSSSYAWTDAGICSDIAYETYDCSDYQVWDSNQVYLGDPNTLVTYDNKVYSPSSWTQNNLPNLGAPWTFKGICGVVNQPPVLTSNFIDTALIVDPLNSVQISLNAQDLEGEIISIEVNIDGNDILPVLLEDSLGNYLLNWTPGSLGNYDIEIKAYDDALALTILSGYININQSGEPVINFISPLADTTLFSINTIGQDSVNLDVKVNDLDGTITNVDFILNNTVYSPIYLGNNLYRLSWIPDVYEEYIFKVQATDNSSTMQTDSLEIIVENPNIQNINLSHLPNQVQMNLGYDKTLIFSEPIQDVLIRSKSIATLELNGNNLVVKAHRTGYTGIKVVTATESYYFGLRINQSNGEVPGMPKYVSMGFKSEDGTLFQGADAADIEFWEDLNHNELKNKDMDFRYTYINGGPAVGKPDGVHYINADPIRVDGTRHKRFASLSLKLGLIPSFVYYNVPDGGESFDMDLRHLQNKEYMDSYFAELKVFLEDMDSIMGDNIYSIVVEPDLIGYMQQNSGKTLDNILTAVNTTYNYQNEVTGYTIDTSAVNIHWNTVLGTYEYSRNPDFSDHLPLGQEYSSEDPNANQGSFTDFVRAVNYEIDKHPNAYFGWKTNLWSDAMHPSVLDDTDPSEFGWTTGRQRVYTAGQNTIQYALDGGIDKGGVDFVVLDKYGLDAMAVTGGSIANVDDEYWFFSSDHWYNYLHFTKALHNESNLPVVIWQLPVGRINGSQTISAYTDSAFEDVPNTPRDWECSSLSWFLGDTMVVPANNVENRFSHFSTNVYGDTNLVTMGDTIVWPPHIDVAEGNGVVTTMYGAGVGNSSDGIGFPPEDDYFSIQKIQDYYLNHLKFLTDSFDVDTFTFLISQSPFDFQNVYTGSKNYFGRGVQMNGVFTPGIAGLGEHTLTYVKQNVTGYQYDVIQIQVTPDLVTDTTLNITLCGGDSIEVGNSTYSTSGFYIDTLAATSGIDSIVFLDLTVNPTHHIILNEDICEGESVTVGSQEYLISGVYIDTLQNQYTCDSIIQLTLNVHNEYNIDLTESICEGESYTLGQHTYNTNGVYIDTLQSAYGCDSIIELTLEVIPLTETELNETICDGDVFNVGNSEYSVSGIYTDTFSLVNGCDSVVTLNLNVYQIGVTTHNIHICEGESYTVGNSIYMTTGTYVDSLMGTLGCDSIVELHLTVNADIETYISDTICSGESIAIGDHIYTTSGSYTANLSSSTGCDSIVYLTLEVAPTYNVSIEDTICYNETFSLGKFTYNTTGVYVDTLLSITGCDSIVTLDLTVESQILTVLNESICFGENYTVGSSVYTETGNYTDTLIAVSGCDSIITLDLFVLPESNKVQNRFICSGDSLVIGTSVYYESGTYIDTLIGMIGCDSIVEVNLSVDSVIHISLIESICTGDTFVVGTSEYSTSGNYVDTLTSMVGCDSVVQLALEVFPEYNIELIDTICANSSTTLGETVYNTSGTYTEIFTTVDGCDSTVILYLTVIEPVVTVLIDTICSDDTYIVDGTSYYSTGKYIDTLVSTTGCDSIISINLTVNPVLTTSLTESMCSGDEYLVGTSVYTASGSYSDTLVSTTGCDSIITLDLTVDPVLTASLTESICSGDEYLVGTSVYTSSGSYTDTLVSITGCDSIITLDLTVDPVLTTSLTESICSGDEYLVGSSVYTTSGSYSDTLMSTTGCDSIVMLDLTVHPVLTTNLAVSLCSGDEYLVGTSVYTSSGSYSDTLTSVTGCDSIITLDLTVHPVLTTSLTESLCSGDEYLVGTSVYTSSGSYSDTLTSVTGCDSIITLDLTVHPVLTTSLTESICSGDEYLVGSSVYTTSGSYSDTLTSVTGCDSIITLDLTVHPVLTTSLTESICSGDEYLVGSSVYTTSGSYSDTLTSVTGCDSIVTLDLTVHPVLTTSLTEMICLDDEYLVGSSVYTTSGSYSDTLTSVTGCDSIVTLDLTVHPVLTTSLTEMICLGDEYLVGTSIYTSSGSYTDILVSITGCDSIVMLDLTVDPVLTISLTESMCSGDEYLVGTSIYTSSGFYIDTLTSVTGCDSIVMSDLTVHPVLITSLTESMCSGDEYLVGTSAYSMSGSYSDTLMSTTGCDSIITLDLTVDSVLTTSLTESMCSGDEYLVGTSVYTSSGSYSDTLVSTKGCDSIVMLDLTVDSVLTTSLNESICSGDEYLVGTSVYTTTGMYSDTLLSAIGCDSIVMLDLTVHPVLTTSLTESMCSGDEYLVGTSVYTSSGSYTDTLVSTTGCDSIVTLDLTINPALTTVLTESICTGDEYLVGTSVYTSSGSYSDTLMSTTGCDSIIMLDLIVHPVLTTSLTESMCSGDEYLVGTSIYTTSGSYSDTLMSTTGCDSIITLDLTVDPVLTTSLTESICTGDEYLVGTSVYTSSGSYSDTLVSTTGCDSIVTLDLTVHSVLMTSLTESMCSGDEYLLGTSIYTTSGSYSDTLMSTTGCDSIVTLDLIVHPVLTTSLNESICSGDEYLVGTSVYTTSGSYSDTLMSTTGCDSIIMLDLTVHPVLTTSLTEIICSGDEYLVGTSVYTTNGSYSDTLMSTTGCDSIVTLDLIVHPVLTTSLTEIICSGDEYLVGTSVYTTNGSYSDTLMSTTGCDSIVTLDLIVHPVLTTSLTESMCSGDEYLVGTSIYTTNGSYSDTLMSTTGCDSIVTLDLTVHPVLTTSLIESMCSGYVYLVGTSVYTTSGSYSDTLMSITGCDSIVTLDLTINPALTTVLTESICTGDEYLVGTSVYTSSGSYSDTLMSTTGCDSIIMLDLIVHPVLTTSLTESICSGDEYLVGTSVYTTSGSYSDTLMSTTGCDSIIMLDLTVHPVLTTSLTEIICSGDEYLVGTSVYTTNGSYSDTLMSTTGCDSIVTLDLIVHPVLTTSLTEIICSGDEYLVGTSVYTTNGSYSDTLMSTTGCDSIVTLDLIVHPVLTTSLTESMCSGDEYLVGTSIYTTNGSYSDTLMSTTGCDSIVMLDLTITTVDVSTMVSGNTIISNETNGVYQWVDCDNGNNYIAGETNQSFTPVTNGNYAVLVSVDSCEAYSSCVHISTIGVDEHTLLTEVSIYPNPSNGKVNLHLRELKDVHVKVVSVTGQLVYSRANINKALFQFKLNVEVGVYFIEIYDKNNNVRRLKLLIN